MTEPKKPKKEHTVQEKTPISTRRLEKSQDKDKSPIDPRLWGNDGESFVPESDHPPL